MRRYCLGICCILDKHAQEQDNVKDEINPYIDMRKELLHITNNQKHENEVKISSFSCCICSLCFFMFSKFETPFILLGVTQTSIFLKYGASTFSTKASSVAPSQQINRYFIVQTDLQLRFCTIVRQGNTRFLTSTLIALAPIV